MNHFLLKGQLNQGILIPWLNILSVCNAVNNRFVNRSFLPNFTLFALHKPAKSLTFYLRTKRFGAKIENAFKGHEKSRF